MYEVTESNGITAQLGREGDRNQKQKEIKRAKGRWESALLYILSLFV